MEHKLIAVIGNTPQVMTETFWALRVQRHVPIDEVFVMTTTIGKATCQKRLLDEGRFEKMLVDYDIDPNTVKFDAAHILVFEGTEDNYLDDIRTSVFGAAKGAYTGQAGPRKGAIRSADGGTLFLDEIGELSHDGQAGLLRVLQEKKVRAIGSDEQEEDLVLPSPCRS